MTTICYKNSTLANGRAHVRDVSDTETVCPGTEGVDGNSRCCGNAAICLPDGICQALDPPPGGSGFSIGGCTDRYYQSNACSKFCTNLAFSDIVYNKTTKQWHCCGAKSDGTRSCNSPTKFHTSAPSPKALLQQYSASTSTASATATASSLPTSASKGGGSRLSSGAAGGIGAGAAIGGIAIIVLIIFLFRARRKKPRQKPSIYSQTGHAAGQQSFGSETGFRSGFQDLPTDKSPKEQEPAPVPPVELSAQERGNELHGTTSPQEMAA